MFFLLILCLFYLKKMHRTHSEEEETRNKERKKANVYSFNSSLSRKEVQTISSTTEENKRILIFLKSTEKIKGKENEKLLRKIRQEKEK